MSGKTVGILHPGQMGVSIAASVKNGGHTVYWASDGRAEHTRERAETSNLVDAGTVADLCSMCETVICVCPPDAAEEVARFVIAYGFQGHYVDANAISPQRARRIAGIMHAAGVAFVDGSIVGPPAWQPNTTWLYLSGDEAEAVAELFSAGPAQAVVMSDVIGHASALKMCYAAYTKGSTALLTTVLGAADSLGVLDTLQEQWSAEGSGLNVVAEERARKVTAKAWRFAGEMDEISATFVEAGMPGGFHEAAADTYRRLADFKDASETPTLDEVLAALQSK